MSGRGWPDPAFLSALAVFSKGRAFAVEARKWSRQGPSGEALAWHLAPVGLTLAGFWDQLGRPDCMKETTNLDTTIHTENDRKIDPGASQIGSIFEPEKQVAPFSSSTSGLPWPLLACQVRPWVARPCVSIGPGGVF